MNIPDLLESAKKHIDAGWKFLRWHQLETEPFDKNNNAISSTGSSGTGGAITAALFLNRFIDKNTNWAHVDLMAWNTSSRPGFPIGGEAMGLRSIVNMIIKYCSKS